MNSNYRDEVLPQVYERYNGIMSKYTLKGLPQNPSNLFSGLCAGTLKSLGICEYLINHNTEMSKNYFYNSVVAARRVLELYDANNGLEVTMGVSMMNFWSLYQGIISENEEATIAFAEVMGGRDEMEKKATTKHVYNLGYALKYIVLNENDKAENYVQQIEKNKSDTYNVGLDEIFRGLLELDNAKTQSGLEKRLANHKRSREFKNTPDEFFSIEVVALTKLAESKGLKIDLDDVIAPREVIEKSTVNFELLEIMKLPY